MSSPQLIDADAVALPGRAALTLKGCIDRVGALVLLLSLSPLLMAVGLLVGATSRGPVFHRRRVVGLHGNELDAFKFRTMVADADRILAQRHDLQLAYHANTKLLDDPRRTSVGRWLRRTSVDELPQLLNVLRGEMSLVGPRMITREELPKYGDKASIRLTVKPGLTGLWQVSGRQELSYDERVALDVHYIENWSLWMDLRILAKTVPAVLSMRGAH